MKKIAVLTALLVIVVFSMPAYAADSKSVNVVVLEPIHADAYQVVNHGLETIYTVPEGKRLVIEFVSASVWVGESAEGTMFLRTGLFDEDDSPHPDIRVHYFVLTPQRTWAGDSLVLVASQPTRLYADPGTDVEVQFGCSTGCSGTTAESHVTISGFLMDVP